MAHYAKLDENNNVIDVIVISNNDCLDDDGNECEEKGRQLCEALSGHAKWKKTSFNTRKGIYYDPETDEPSDDQSKAFRINYGSVGMKYDEDLNGFIQSDSNKINDLTQLNTQTGYYEYIPPSVPLPDDSQLDQYPLEFYRSRWYWDLLLNQWIRLPRTTVVTGRYLPQNIFYPEE